MPTALCYDWRMEPLMDAETAAAWAAYEAMLQQWVEEGRLDPDLAASLQNEQGRQMWLRVYLIERARSQK